MFAGNWHTSHCLQPAVEGAEIALELAPEQRQRTVWRIDGGAGSDDHLRWLVSRGYHIVAKGMNNRRAEALARQRAWPPGSPLPSRQRATRTGRDPGWWRSPTA